MSELLEVIDATCENCVGACCKAGTAIQLTEREAYKNKREMKLERALKARRYPQQIIIQAEGFNEKGERIPVPTPMTIAADHGLYSLTEDCGHLTDGGQCDIYDSPTRPPACRNYEMGSAACLGARQAAGLIDLAPPVSEA